MEYGITINDITARVPIAINVNTRPNIAGVEAMIVAHAARVRGIAKAVGIDPTEPSQDSYRIIRLAVLYGVLSEVFASQDRGVENSTFFRQKGKEMEDQLRADPQTVDRPEGPNRARVFSRTDGRDTLNTIRTQGYGSRRILR